MHTGSQSGSSDLQRLAVQEAATLALIKALKFCQRSEFSLAHQIMKDCNPASSRLQYAFLSRICQSGRFADAALALETYPQQADQLMYITIRWRLARADIEGVPLSVHPL